MVTLLYCLVPVSFQSGGYPVRLVRQGRYLHHWLIVNASCSSVLILTADSLPVDHPRCMCFLHLRSLKCGIAQIHQKWIRPVSSPRAFLVSFLGGADSTASIELRVWRTCIDVHMIGDEQHFSGNFQDSRIRFRPEFIALHRLGFGNC